MNLRSLQIAIGSMLLAMFLVACGSGGKSAGDTYPDATPAAPVAVSGPDSFLLYPNQQTSPAIDSSTYAQAYYAAIDPTNAKDTLAKWRAANGFGNAATGVEKTIVFGDKRDLGYGRYVTARKNNDGTIAFQVDNYLIAAAGYSYTTLNLDAAVVQDSKWYIGTNAIEFSPGPNGGASFAKFFTFSPTTGVRLLAAQLDGRGDKAMPGICTNCHGGRGDPLTAPNGLGVQLFPKVGLGERGDLRGKLHFFEPDTFDFSAAPYDRVTQEANIKTLNQWVLCTYPLPTGTSTPTGNAEDTCRSVAQLNEWQGGAAVDMKAAYGGDGMPNASYHDTFVPAAWSSPGQTSLYQNVVQPDCRVCHALRGIGLQSDQDFSNFTAFQTYADRIKAHVIDRGNMPLSKLIYTRYWATPSTYNEMNAFLQNEGYTVLDGGGAPLLPGRPIADPGPSRTAGVGASILSAANSLYADTYAWSIITNPGGATLTSATGIQTTFNATVNGSYVVQLVASKGAVQSTPVQLTIVVNNALSPLPAAITFANIKAVLQGTCIACHTPTGGTTPPIIYDASFDRNGDGVIDATDDTWLYYEVRGRINFKDIIASPLLRKPSNNHHFGGLQTGFDTTLAPGAAGRANYDLFLNWILNGAPQ